MSTSLSMNCASSRLRSVNPVRRLSLRVARDVCNNGMAPKHPRPLLRLQRRKRRQCSCTGPPGDPCPPELIVPTPSESQALGAESGWGPATVAAPPAELLPATAAAAATAVGAAGGPLPDAGASQPAAAAAGMPRQPPSGVQQQEQQQEQQQQEQQPRGQQESPVPWGLATTVTVMVVWLLAFWLAAYSLVPFIVEGLGMDPRSAGARVQAFKHFLLDVTQLGLTVGILWRGLAEYHPRSLGLFSLSFKPWRSWVAPTLAGLATFPAIDWLHHKLITVLAVGEDYLLSGTVEQIAGTSDWAAHVLWCAVLAVCAPLWEEAMFRGFLLPSLCRQLPRWGAVLASAAVFSLVHFTREGFLPLLLLGLVFGGVYVQTRSLWPPILLHSLWNAWLLAQILLRASASL